MAPPAGPVYRVGIIGCGGIADLAYEEEVRGAPGFSLFPFSHAGVYQRHPRTQLVAAAEIDPARLHAFGERWLVPARYADYREMLACERLDVVSIAGPTALHHPMTLEAARQGVKGIFLEKPIARTLAEADEMIAACRAAGVVVAVNHSRAYDPYYRAAAGLIRDGEIGELRGVLATWREGIAQGGTHLFDLLWRTVRSSVDWVFCHLERDEARVDPGGDAYLVFKNGLRAHLHMPFDGPAAPQVDFIGSEGRVRVGAYAFEWWTLDRRHGRAVPAQLPFPGRHDGRSGMYVAVDELLGAIEGGEPPASTLGDGRVALEIIVALLKSGKEGGIVRLPVADTTFVAESWL